MLYYSTIFLAGSRKKSGHIDQCQDGDLESVAESNKSCGFARTVDVEATGQHHGLVGDHTDRCPLKANKSGNDVAGEVGLDFKEVALVSKFQHQLLDVIRCVWILGHQRIQRFLNPVGCVACELNWWPTTIAQGQKINKSAHLKKCLNIIVIGSIRNRRSGCVRSGTSQLLGRNRFVRDGFHHIRSGYEHVGAVADHENEISHGRRINRPSGARPHDNTDLWHDARCKNVALKNLGITGQRINAFLDSRTA